MLSRARSPPGLPGRGTTGGTDERPTSREAAMAARGGDDLAGKAERIVAGLGGIDNIVEVEGCITRLRTEVEDPSLVDEAALRAAGAMGVVSMGTAVQVVVGPEADPLASEIEDLM
ncbi:PTS glucose/sucrose transporter subunit IIB [Streptomyces alkaliphilus]|uniref:PTS glucose/sucrose transporter subunit IIB n=1 Tax=Streptomyces alkaliphilus TaxID=1472722 RepID=UPI00225E1EB2|nr:PTS glucose/sucrose transporter subunit IIB [Streptomyces alkaliphilus]